MKANPSVQGNKFNYFYRNKKLENGWLRPIRWLHNIEWLNLTSEPYRIRAALQINDVLAIH
jgi:hypothetical protein